MRDQSPTSPPRPARPVVTAAGLLLTGLVALVVAAALGLWVADQIGSTRLWRVDSVVAPVVVAVGALATAWVGVSALVAATCAAVRVVGGVWRVGEGAVQRWAPGLVRRALVVVVATGVGLGGAVGAHATVAAPPAAAVVTVDLGGTPTSTDLTSPTTEDQASVVTGPALPADVTDGEQRAHTAPAEPSVTGTTTADLATAPVVLPVAAQLRTPTDPAPGTAPTDGVTVRPGDTLWGIAARSLGPGATDAAIAAEWPRWYAANASTIGPDPDVLQPGQVLTIPTATDGGGPR